MDPDAWIRLGAHYDVEGDRIAADRPEPGESGSDPSSAYEMARDCYERAEQLGAGGYAFCVTRAQAAANLGMRREAARYARKALEAEPPTSSDPDVAETHSWLRETIDRDTGERDPLDMEDEHRRIRDARVRALSLFLRWPFDL